MKNKSVKYIKCENCGETARKNIATLRQLCEYCQAFWDRSPKSESAKLSIMMHVLERRLRK